VLLQRLRDIALQGEAYRKQHPKAKTLPPSIRWCSITAGAAGACRAISMP
jgi:hypothetical protein